MKQQPCLYRKSVWGRALLRVQTRSLESAGSPSLHEAAAGMATISTTDDLLFQLL